MRPYPKPKRATLPSNAVAKPEPRAKTLAMDLDSIEGRIDAGPPGQWKDLTRAPWTIQLEKDARHLLAELRKRRGR